MTQISLCMIVRNEERMLPACLASVTGVVDQIVIVDTGSTDATIEIAKAAGAEVLTLPWQDDFAAPRNLALTRATGQWILQLDADERLAPGSGERLARALRNASFDCGLVRLHDAMSVDAPIEEVLAGRKRVGAPSLLPRVLRRAPDLHYQGIIHENVEAWIVARGNRIHAIDVDLLHLGQIPDVRAERDKARRNIDLLFRRCEQEADDIAPFGYLALELLFIGRFDEARAVIDRAWKLLDRQPRYRSTLRLSVARARVALSSGDADGALEAVEVGERSEGIHPDLLFLRGCASELKGRGAPRGSDDWTKFLNAALEKFEHAIRLHGCATQGQFISGSTSFAAQTRLGTVKLYLGKPEEAEAAFEKALAQAPTDPEAGLGLVESLVDQGKYDAALRRVEPMLTASPDGWLLSAAAALGLNAVNDMKTFLAVARQRCGNGYLAWHRSFRHAEMLLLHALADGTPQDGPGGIGSLTGIMARQKPRSGFVIPTRSQIESVIKVAVLSRQFAALDALFERRVARLVPGIVDTTREILGALGIRVHDDGEPAPIFVGGASAEEAGAVASVMAAHSRLKLNADAAVIRQALGGDDGGQALRAIVRADAGAGTRTVWPCNGEFESLDLLAGLFPRARFVHVVAERVDTASCLPAAPAAVGTDPRSRTTAEIRLKAAHCRDRYREFRYDTFLSNPADSVEELMRFIGENTEAELIAQALAVETRGS